MKKIAILQSNYIPWKGYFDIIAAVDEFILYDDMQYTRRDWRNRNKIMTPNGEIWLTIPVETKGKFYQKINETKVSGHQWINDHIKSLRFNYAKAACFDCYSERIFSIYDKCRNEDYLSMINYYFIIEICNILGIDTSIKWSSEFTLAEGKTERLVQLVLDAGGDYYLSGPAARNYINPVIFDNAGIKLDWMDYNGYQEYRQLGSQFSHNVSILDLIFNEGDNASSYMKYSCGGMMKGNI